MSDPSPWQTISSENAENYQRYVVPGVFAGFTANLVARARVQPGERVLDVGCGTGALTSVLAEIVGAELVAGVDPSEPFVERARERVPGADLRVAPAEALPFEDDTFDVAFAAGFSSIRQFNDTIRDVFAATPSELRARANGNVPHDTSAITGRLAARAPFATADLLEWLGGRAIPGLETRAGISYARVLCLIPL